MFCGLAYFAGLVDRHRRRNHATDLVANSHQLGFLGNGGRYLYLLDAEDSNPLHGLLGELFSAGAGLSTPTECTGLAPHPKAAIALGLVHGAMPHENNQDSLYDCLEIRNAALPGLAGPANLYDFYSHFDKAKGLSWSLAEDSDFALFLHKVDRVLPGGKFRASHQREARTVVPGVSGNANWARGYAQSAIASGKLAEKIKERISMNADEYRQDLLKNEKTFSVEPLFITELVALLRSIRATHAV